mmetsp:Transcript_1455/g.3038  ORF Transcript_1455/g.3038 Transcript_1455/m.3038 type:complete len:1794 (-) Transcript_1455:138-5519(-)
MSFCDSLALESQYPSESIEILTSLDRHLRKGMQDHLVLSEIVVNCRTKLEEWRVEQRKIDYDMDFGGKNAEVKIKSWASLLNKNNPTESNVIFKNISQFFNHRPLKIYDKKLEELKTKVCDRFNQGRKALKDSDYLMVQECIHTLGLINKYVGNHIPNANNRLSDLEKQVVVVFLDICKRAQIMLQCNTTRIQFKTLFLDYRSLVLHVPCVMQSHEADIAFRLTNQLAYENLVADIDEIKDLLKSFDFSDLKKKIMYTRKYGELLADHYTLLLQRVKTCNHIRVDQWLEKIFALSLDHFSYNRQLHLIKYFSILDVIPSTDKNGIKKAYRTLAKRYHPDKTGSDNSQEFRKIQEAYDFLMDKGDFLSMKNVEYPFESIIKDIRKTLCEGAKVLLEEQRYDAVDTLLFKLSDLKSLDYLVTPRINHNEVVKDVKALIGRYVKKIRIDVDSNWCARNYCALNESISDLKMMENHLKSHPDIFSSSWNQGIVNNVEKEIERLGICARGYISSQKKAYQNLEGFRRCFINMGHVLVDLPLFKDTTKNVMCDVLESCLSHDWGYSFLFKFGSDLQRSNGENVSDEEKKVAKFIVSEFSHFKEVMTMVWNEETLQKPAEETVHGIKSKCCKNGIMNNVPIHKNSLLESFHKFEDQYKKLLMEYIDPNADLKKLVQDTLSMAGKLKPIDCDSGWSKEVKNQIPYILAGVFSVFTVRKSGESYNRLSEDNTIGDKLLMKPHNIQVLTLLALFGCGSSSRNRLDSQLMQIRTGEGKSMILGAAAVVLACLGFRVRCVCYSEYLSDRDYGLFQDVFTDFGVLEHVKYSKITTLSEDTTAAKGNIRKLTEALLYGNLKVSAQSPAIGNTAYCATIINTPYSSTTKLATASLGRSENGNKNSTNEECGKNIKLADVDTCPSTSKLMSREEILLVDEVDVFFGADFYGQTYNQVAQLQEPEVVEILRHIWNTNKRGGRTQRLTDIQALPVYASLLQKISGFKYFLDTEISQMINQVQQVNKQPYYVDLENSRIGYKVMDTISYEATYGYRTIFAYLQEAERGNMDYSKIVDSLVIPISCGQFSYANISPKRILGVSGTLSALGEYEIDILSKYGVDTFMFVPSVYGDSNFQFDKAGNGILIDTSKSDHYHSISSQIKCMVNQKRSVIVFFQDSARLKEFTDSAFYCKLGRQKNLLTEDLPKSDKEFVISKAATVGQITISTAVFGRGTDFFCKDEIVQRHGGVHVIQTFLSENYSEEIQIQGRTARQGKKGSYQMILLESDLIKQFKLQKRLKDRISKRKLYDCLSSARNKCVEETCKYIEKDLLIATERDQDTHQYFDALLANRKEAAANNFKKIYNIFKKSSMPSSIELDLAFLIDITGSMAPYMGTVTTVINTMLSGSGSLISKLKAKFPDIIFHLRTGFMGFRDIDDGSQQFVTSKVNGKGHFLKNVEESIQFVNSITKNPSGGGDIAEDILGAIYRCAKWNSYDDWNSTIKFILVLTDAPAHGFVPTSLAHVPNVDGYSIGHPNGLKPKGVIDCLIKNDIDLFFCSFNPAATLRTEEELSKKKLYHGENTDKCEIITIPMVPVKEINTEVLCSYAKHIVFVLDMSGSMRNDWNGVVSAYNQYIARRKQNQSDCDLISVVQFDNSAEITVNKVLISQAPNQLRYDGGGTSFDPASQKASALAGTTPLSHAPVIVFMSDGCAGDASSAAKTFSTLNNSIKQTFENELELHVIAFGKSSSLSQLQEIANSSKNGKLHKSTDTAELSHIFVEIANAGGVADVLETEIGKKISEAVSDKLTLEYIG